MIDCELFSYVRLLGVQRVRLRRLFDQQPRQVSHSYPIVLYAFVVVFLCILFLNYNVMPALGYYQSGEVARDK